MTSSYFRGLAQTDLATLPADHAENLLRVSTDRMVDHALRYASEHEPTLTMAELRPAVEEWVSLLDSESRNYFCGTMPGASFADLRGAVGVLIELALMRRATRADPGPWWRRSTWFHSRNYLAGERLAAAIVERDREVWKWHAWSFDGVLLGEGTVLVGPRHLASLVEAQRAADAALAMSPSPSSPGTPPSRFRTE